MLELDAQVGVVLAGQAPDVLHRAAADLAALPRELHHVADVELGRRARAERPLVTDEARVATTAGNIDRGVKFVCDDTAVWIVKLIDKIV